MARARHTGTPLTQAEVDALPEGAPIVVTWSGGNGPHRYTIGVHPDGRRFALLQKAQVPGSGWRWSAEPLDRFDYQTDAHLSGVGPASPSTIVTLDTMDD